MTTELFCAHIRKIRGFVESRPDRRTFRAPPSRPWPKGGAQDVVLMGDVGVELGSPQTESFSLLLWTCDLSLVKNGEITLIGPDLAESGTKSMAFGKIVLLGTEGFTEENTYRRYREMEQLRFLLDLKGYMIRAVSQYQREWCRVSREALDRGFSLLIVGSSLMRMYRGLDYVRAAEIIFITRSAETVGAIRLMTSDTARIIAAMNKMAGETDFDCKGCEYRDVCDEAGYLRDMRSAYLKKMSRR